MIVKVWKAKKAGKLANGFERDRGALVHAVISDYEPTYSHADSVCGSRPSISWSVQDHAAKVTCKKCLKKMEGWK